MQKIPGKNTDLWSPTEILYAVCYTCGTHLAWRKYYKSQTLVGSCCGYAFTAEPMFNFAKFRVVVHQPDLTNVVILSVLDDPAPGS